MKTVAQIRHENLLKLIKESGGEDFLASRYECSVAYIKQMARGYKDASGTPKGIGDNSARRLEVVTGKEIGWMDHEHPIINHVAELGETQLPLGLNDDERRLLLAFRTANSPQRQIAMTWANANQPYPIKSVTQECSSANITTSALQPEPR